jgi:hypothetical protein
MLVETACLQCHGVRREQGLLAVATARGIGHACRRNPVNCNAVGTDDML